MDKPTPEQNERIVQEILDNLPDVTQRQLPELPVAALCTCCKCQGKKCLAWHPGHDHQEAMR